MLLRKVDFPFKFPFPHVLYKLHSILLYVDPIKLNTYVSLHTYNSEESDYVTPNIYIYIYSFNVGKDYPRNCQRLCFNKVGNSYLRNCQRSCLEPDR